MQINYFGVLGAGAGAGIGLAWHKSIRLFWLVLAMSRSNFRIEWMNNSYGNKKKKKRKSAYYIEAMKNELRTLYYDVAKA